MGVNCFLLSDADVFIWQFFDANWGANRDNENALRCSVRDLTDKSDVSTITRAELVDGEPTAARGNLLDLKNTIKAAGPEFIGKPEDDPENCIRTESQATRS